MDTSKGAEVTQPTASVPEAFVPRPRIVGPAGAQISQSSRGRGNRLDRYRDRYSEFRGGAPVLLSGKQPVPVFLTLKFWRGLVLIGLVNITAFWTIGNVDMSWLIHPVPNKHPAGAPTFAWPKGMVPLQVERTSSGELIVTVPTRGLTPDEQATLKKIWDSERSSGTAKQAR